MAARVLGVLGGRDLSAGLLARWADSADLVIAADSGADRLIEAGRKPHRIVGDMDSASPDARSLGVPIVLDQDQETTDCDKLLSQVRLLGHNAVTLACVEGDLMDHTLASLSSSLKCAAAVRLALRNGIAVAVKPGEPARIATTPGTRISLIPAVECLGAELRGVEWPLQNARISPLGILSVSNAAVGGAIEASLGSGAAWLFVGLGEEQVPCW